MTSNQRSREAAYADLVTGLIDARVDVASERFDAELEAAEAAGRLDPASARLLRWWQRESVRAVTEHALSIIPGTLVALEHAAAEAREAVNRADAAWTTARGVTARTGYPGPAAPTDAAPAPVSVAVPSAPSDPYAPYVPADPADPAPLEPYPPAQQYPPAQYAPEPVWTPPPVATYEDAPLPSIDPYAPTLEPPGYPSAAAPAPVETAYAPSPEEAPAIVDLTEASSPDQNPTATPAEGRRRTLLAGLTVLPRSD